MLAQLARARRRILVIDGGSPRNRFAEASHGFLGHDGKAPRALLDEALRQVRAYPTVRFLQGQAVAARASPEGFVLTLQEGPEERGARLVLATGLRDELPPIPGLRERWGSTVLHCPYCHGYEVRDQPLGVLANHPLSAHQALLLPDWGPTTLFTQGTLEPDAELTARLAVRGVRLERTPIVELLGEAPALEAVRLRDGRVVPLGALFAAPRTSMSSPLAQQLGCAFDEGPTGPHVRVDEKKATTVPGVFAAGDAASPLHNATLASAAGALAGFAVHHSLTAERSQPDARPT